MAGRAARWLLLCRRAVAGQAGSRARREIELETGERGGGADTVQRARAQREFKARRAPRAARPLSAKALIGVVIFGGPDGTRSAIPAVASCRCRAMPWPAGGGSRQSRCVFSRALAASAIVGSRPAPPASNQMKARREKREQPARTGVGEFSDQCPGVASRRVLRSIEFVWTPARAGGALSYSGLIPWRRCWPCSPCLCCKIAIGRADEIVILTRGA